jgi:ABC-type phosphate/phosphonate transport system substrate-binding protein
MGHPALTHYLRTNIALRPVLCEIYIYKSSSNAVEALLRGEVDIMQLNPVAYIEARQRKAAITPLVAQTHDGKTELRGAIFVHASSGIGGLQALGGHSFAFAELDSAIGHYLPKIELLAAGLHARDLSGWTNCRPWHASRLVRQGQFAAGAADLWEAENLIAAGAPLHILKEVHSPTAVWVAASKMDPALRTAIQQSLLSLTDRTILAGISRGLTGFRTMTPADYDELQQQMARASLFDQAAEPPP